MLNRREWLGLTVQAGSALTLLGGRGTGALAGPPRAHGGGPRASELITRAVPKTGERLPLVGLGSSATFSRMAPGEDADALGEVLRTMVELGGSVFDTAPGYGASEEVAGRLARELGIADRIFWATKVNVAPRGGGSADPDAARAQIARSFERLLGSPDAERPIDLIQVHNLADVPTQLAILKELKAQGRVRYIGVTTTSERQYGQLESIMREEPIDFIGIDYAIDNRGVEERVLPLAQEREIGVLVYAPFGRTRLWNRVEGRDVPAWAQEFGAATWAQFFLKFVGSHPAVTVITPATSRPAHMRDNMGAATGTLPDDATRRRMVELVEALPPASR